MFRNPCAASLLLTFCFVICISVGYSDDSFVWNLLKKKVAANFLKNPALVTKSVVPGFERKSSLGVEPYYQGLEKAGSSSRQYGWGHSQHYGGGGGYDIYSLIAVAGFAALFGALFFELLGGSLRRSMGQSKLNLPFNLDSEKIPEIVSKISEWVTNSKWFENLGVKSRTVREIREKAGFSQWLQAYRRDPVQFQCIRKLACETLAGSPLAARSMKSQFGGVVISALGRMMNNGPELLNIIEGTVGNPEICNSMVPYGFCETDNSSNEKQSYHFR